MLQDFLSSPVRKSLAVLLMGLLALTPFLHGHLGASHISGFHIDGISIGHAAEAGPAMTDADEESPALGVAASLPKSVDADGALINAGWLCALLLLVLARAPGLRRRPALARSVRPRTYRAGWPPPALAPPSQF